MDRERGRITLDFKLMDAQAWGRAIEVLRGRRRDGLGLEARTGRVILSIDEGLEEGSSRRYYTSSMRRPGPARS
jgi:hypothetical protein